MEVKTHGVGSTLAAGFASVPSDVNHLPSHVLIQEA